MIFYMQSGHIKWHPVYKGERDLMKTVEMRKGHFLNFNERWTPEK